jgi:hypothetical protein
VAVTATYTDPYAVSGVSARTVATTWTGLGAHAHERIHGLTYADAAFVRVTLSTNGNVSTRVERVRVPYTTQEAL